MSLRKLLKNFCIDAYHELTSRGELPRPPYTCPLIVGNIGFVYTLSQLDSYTELQQYMRSSGLSDKLHDIGHTWLWHEEVFQWLFLERVIAESSGISLDVTAFNKVFNRAQAEISRGSFRVRRITILNGLPKLNSTIVLDKGVLLSPIDFSMHEYTLANLLGGRFQDNNGAPSFRIDPDNCLLIQDAVIQKGNDGKNLLESREQLRNQASTIMKVLKLSLDTPVYPKAGYFAYLSGFPMLPISHKEFEEFSGFSFSIQRDMTRAEITAIKKNLKLISSRLQEGQNTKFFFALDRLSDSFRDMKEKQSIVDLIVALEALLGVVDEELKRRLATNTAFLLGTNDSERETVYRQVSAGYELRNTIVHGGEKQAQRMAKALKRFFPKLEGKSSSQVTPHVRKAVEELQKVVRLVLRAYIYMRLNKTRTEWPKAEDFEYLPFDPNKRRPIQKQLGIKRSPPKQPDITCW